MKGAQSAVSNKGKRGGPYPEEEAMKEYPINIIVTSIEKGQPSKQENEKENKMDMVLTLEVKGNETLKATIEYGNTTKETVVSVQNAFMQALQGINDESLKK